MDSNQKKLVVAPMEQWQRYNPLDKKSQDVSFDRSNKFPYCKPEKSTTLENMLQPKVSTIGVIPPRKTTDVEEMEVMVVGKSARGTKKADVAEKENEKEEIVLEDEPQLESEEIKAKRKKKREKMPAIISSVGTTGKINFSTRKKPKEMPMTKLKGKNNVTKPPLVPAPPNSRMSKRTASIISSQHDVVISISRESDKVSEAPPSSPTGEYETEDSVPPVREAVSARSVDDIIKSLRTSREGTEVKSSSDIRIDELLQQVLGHSDEWSNKDETKRGEDREKETELQASVDREKPLEADAAEEELDLSDTVSTLASQISAPAGIPDVAAILLRRSSEAGRRPESELSGFSSPMMGAGDGDDYVDAAQALKDLNQTLDVRNEDIISVRGKPAPVAKHEPTSEDEGYYDGLTSGSETERFQPLDLTTTVTTGGRIHHLCLLAANTATQFDVSPSDAALSRLLHTTGNRRNALEATDQFAKKTMELPPAPPPSQAPTTITDDASLVTEKRCDTSPGLAAVLEEVEEYNRLGDQKDLVNKAEVVDRPETLQLDTSKIDPLDIEAWRRLADNVIETTDLTQQGERCVGKESNMWRLIWDPAPPKMLIPPVAVKAALFPHYHGIQLTSATADGQNLSLLMEESESESEDDEEHTGHEINLLTLNRRHKSDEDLTQISRRRSSLYIEEPPELQRSISVPEISEMESSDSPEPSSVQLKSDYSTAMEELQQQRAQAMEKEQENALLTSAMTAPISSAMPIKLEAQVSTAAPEVKAKKSTQFTEPVPPEKKISLAELSRQGGQEYVPYRRKSRRKTVKKNHAIVLEVRRMLASYEPIPLMRSQSLERGLDHAERVQERPPTRRSAHGMLMHKNMSRSIPKDLNFQEFIDRHDNPENEDIREWVRDIWNEWFEEVIPPSVSDEESWTSSSSDHEEDELAALTEKKPGVLLQHPGSGSSAGKLKLPTTIPDVLEPVVVTTGYEYEFIDETATIEVMEREVNRLSVKIETLESKDLSTKAILISRRGALNRKLGQIKLAKDDLYEALEIEPRLAAAYWHRHLISLLENKAHEALDDLNILLKLDKRHVHAYRSRADIFASLGDFTMAIVNYSQAIKLQPSDEDAYFQRAQLYEKKGDMLLALEDYGAVVRINPARTDALLKRGRFHFAQKNWHSTIADFTHMIQREPHNALARTYRGRAYAALKQYESALSDLSASIHLDPLNWRAFYHRACLLRTLAPEKSLQDFSCSLLINDSYDNAMALLHRGILYTELKRYPEAVVDFEEALRLDHGLACAHVNIGLVHHQITRNYLEAIKRFTNALTVDPTYTRAYMCRADSYELIGEHRKALHDVTRAIVLRPDDRHLYLRRGQLLLLLGELKLAGFCVRHIATLGEGIISTSATQQAVVQSFLKNHGTAIEGLSAACRVKPVPHMYVLLGKTLMKAKQFKEAIFNFKNALDLLGSSSFSTITSTSEKIQSSSGQDESAEVHFLLGQCHTQLEQHTKALNAYNHALKANPDYAVAYYRRGLCRLKMDHAKGVQDLNRALALDPSLFEAYLSRAAFYGQKGRYSKAILNCNEALRLRPGSVRAYLYRGALKFHICSYQLAVQDLTSAIKLERTCALAYFNRAACFQRMKKFKEALKDYSVVLMLDESKPEAQTTKPKGKYKKSKPPVPLRLRVCVNRGLLYLRDLDDPFNAALDFEAVTEMEPQSIRVLHTMALCYHKLKMLNEATDYYTRCLAVDPYFLVGYIGRGDAYADGNDVISSRRDYQRALRLNPMCVSARINLGFSLQSTGKLRQAWLQFTRAIELDPRSQQAFEGRAVTCLRAGNIEAAFQDILAAFRAGAPTARLHAARGVVHQYMGDVRDAMTDYQRAIKLDDAYSLAFFNAAALYLRDRRFREALAYLDKAIQLTPNDDAALTNRGITRVLLNDKDRALTDFNEAIKLNDTNAHTFFNRGNLLAMLNRFEEAETDYSTAFSIDPSDYGALKKRADVRGKLGRKQQAIEDYKAALKLYERKKFLAGAA